MHVRAGRMIRAVGSTFTGAGWMTLQESFLLFRRLGVDAESVSRIEFRVAYYRLARRYHPDLSQLMANIDAARSTILKSYLPG
jgi:hypothetical protein